MSELSKNVYSKYPFIVKAKARGYYDYKSTQVITNSSNIVLEMKKFEGLDTTFTKDKGYPLVVSTKSHTLPNWNFIEDTKNVFMPVGKKYKSIGEINNINLNGCLYNYTDTGAADTLNMFSVEKEDQDTSIILTKEETPSIENSVVTYLGTVNVPQHNIYDYSETEGYTPFDVTLVGSDATYDESTYEFTGSKASESYIKLNYDLKESDNLTIITKVKFNDVSSSAAVFCSSTNVWWIGEINGRFGGYLSGAKSSDFTFEANKTYWLKVVEDELNLKLYAVEDNNYSIDDVSFGDAVYSTGRYGLTKNGFIFGANIGYNSENLDGTIYLKDSKLTVNNDDIFGTVVIGDWSRK